MSNFTNTEIWNGMVVEKPSELPFKDYLTPEAFKTFIPNIINQHVVENFLITKSKCTINGYANRYEEYYELPNGMRMASWFYINEKTYNYRLFDQYGNLQESYIGYSNGDYEQKITLTDGKKLVRRGNDKRNIVNWSIE